MVGLAYFYLNFIFFCIVGCKIGFTSRDGEPCKVCPDNLFGKRCLFLCSCETTERFADINIARLK